MSTPPKHPSAVPRELDASIGSGFILGSSRLRSDTIGSNASAGKGKVRSGSSSLNRGRSDTTGSNASTGKVTGLEIPQNRMRSTTAVKRYGVGDVDRMNSSLSNSMSGDEDNLRDLVGDINLPMPKEDPLSTPSMSRSSSRRKIERKYSVASEIEEGIGEALQHLSHSIALSRATSNSNLSPRPSLYFLKKPSSVMSHQSAQLGNTMPSSSITFPGVPVVVEDICSPSSSAYQRTTSPSQESSCYEEEVCDFECADIAELQKALRFRFEQLTKAVDMGQQLYSELGQVRAELNTVLEERETLLAENETQKNEYEEFKRHHKKLTDQLRDANSKIAELAFVHKQQEEELQQVQAEREQEKEELQKKQEDLIENAKWQEEKFVEVQEAAKKAKPNNEQIMQMKAAIHEGFIRKGYFHKLRLWMSQNRKKRYCFNILLTNMRQEMAHREFILDMYFERWMSEGKALRQMKLDHRIAFGREEAAARAALVEEAMTALIGVYLEFSQQSNVAWQVSIEEGESVQQDLVLKQKHQQELHAMVQSEDKWRKDLLTQCWEKVATILVQSVRVAADEWVSAKQEVISKNSEISRIRTQWQHETAQLRKAYADKDTEADTLLYKIQESEKRLAVSETTIRCHTEEIDRLRKVNLEKQTDVTNLREMLERTDAELSNARGQVCVIISRLAKPTKTA
eukprot:TRINITY_DN13976_c3_g1_i2.p1 TRINITY_DN13976_c3_g1~~TRINITY_DN13976_c3_g1_i2.p1  ORF type:complete len:700 (+),score=260.24 TRINITY_DN13976_c3_g1_i2:48-2102(+)